MDRSAFKPDTRYTVALRDVAGRERPANLYVYRAYDKFMIARSSGNDGLLRKIAYESVLRVVQERPVDPALRYHTPAALLDEKFWAGREVLEHYANSPALGK
jgi:hypothetical protein